MRTRVPALAAVVIAASVLGACGSSSPADDGKTTIAVIPKGTSHVFWQSIHAGAEKAAQEWETVIASRRARANLAEWDIAVDEQEDAR